jgi:hypothetical protein
MRTVLTSVRAKVNDLVTSHARKLELGLTAAVSILKTSSDVWSVWAHVQAGHYGTAYTIIATVSVSMLLQSLLVIVQNQHCGWKAVAKEVGIVFSGLKPVVDTRRLHRGSELDGAPIPRKLEGKCRKIIVTVVESVPKSIAQAAAVLVDSELRADRSCRSRLRVSAQGTNRPR